MDGLFAVTAADTDTVDNVALLGLVPKTAGLVGAGRTRSTVDHVQLAVFPAADAEEEAEDIALLLLVKGRNLYIHSFQAAISTGQIERARTSVIALRT